MATAINLTPPFGISARFAETLLPIIDSNTDRAVELASEVLATFSARFSELSLAGMRRKLGLSLREDGDPALAEDLLEAMHRNQADFTLTFRGLCDAAERGEGARAGDARPRSLFANPQDYDEWAVRWRARLARELLQPRARAEAMRQVNPAFIRAIIGSSKSSKRPSRARISAHSTRCRPRCRSRTNPWRASSPMPVRRSPASASCGRFAEPELYIAVVIYSRT